MSQELLDKLRTAVASGNRDDAKALVQQGLDQGMDPETLLNDAMVVAMGDVGERFKNGEIFIPQMLIAARAMKESLAILEPILAASGVEPDHTVLIGTVEGDLHDIGKNLVAVLWKGANFKVADLGVNVRSEQFLAAIEEHKPTVVGLSTLLTTTMPAMRSTAAAIRERFGDSVKIVVGGAPVTQAFADEIGADGYAPDAASGVDLARSLCG